MQKAQGHLLIVTQTTQQLANVIALSRTTTSADKTLRWWMGDQGVCHDLLIASKWVSQRRCRSICPTYANERRTWAIQRSKRKAGRLAQAW